jgi:hypothetical protein
MSTLSQAEFTELRDKLVDAFDEESQMAQLVRAAAGRSLHRVAMGKDLEEITAKVIQSAQNQGWLPALIKEAWQARQSDPVLTRFHEAWKVPAAEAPVDHRKVLLLPGKTVLIDRGPLRDALMTLEDANGSRVLIVDGDPESGKTYSVHYISYLASARRTFRYAYVDLERVPRNAHDQIDALTLGDAIALALLARTYAPPTDFNLITWVDQYCMWMEQQLPEHPVSWLVIDNFVKVGLDESTFDLVAELAMRTYRNLRSVRLVLLSYRDRELLQSRVVGTVEYERISGICREDLVRFFGQLHLDESVRRGETLDKQALATRVIASVKRVLAKVPENGVRRLEVLCRTAWIEAESILRPPAAEIDPLDALVEQVNRFEQSGLDVSGREEG